MKIAKSVIIIGFAIGILPCTVNAQQRTTVRVQKEVKQDTLSIMIKRAESGDAAAQNTLGTWYYAGRYGATKDYNKAAHWWAKSAQQENADGVGNLALCYQLGRGLKADSVKAISLYKLAIGLGNNAILSQHERLAEGKNASLFSVQLMYQCYSQGIGVKRDNLKALKYRAILAEGGNADEKYKLALEYLNRQQPDQAVPWLRKAAKANHIGAIFYLGRLLYRGTGIAQNREQGIAMMEQAAAKDFVGACLEMGKIYLSGDDVERDARKGASYLQKVAGVSPEGGWLLAQCYLKGDGVQQDYFKATQWIAEYAGSYRKDLQTILEENSTYNYYLSGLHEFRIKHNPEKAIACFKKVSKAKVAEGQTMVAYSQRSLNEKKAAKAMVKAAKISSVACLYLSEMYKEGKGVKRDREKALELLQRAAEEGIAEAQCQLADRYMEGNGVSQDYVKAASLYLNAEAQHQLTPQAASRLARCYKLKVSSLPDLSNATERIAQLEKAQTNNKLEKLLAELYKL